MVARVYLRVPRRCIGTTGPAAVAVLVAATIALGACGGSAAPSPAAFSARAGVICAASLRSVRATSATTGIGVYAATVGSLIRAEASRLRALRRPAAGWQGAGAFSEYLAALDGEVSALRRLAGAARLGDAGGEASAVAALRASPASSRAAAAGLSECARPAATVG